MLCLMKFKYVPLPAQHFLMVNWDTCLVLPAWFWHLEGPRVFRAGMCKSVSFHKKDLSIGHRTFFSKYFKYHTHLNVRRQVARIWISRYAVRKSICPAKCRCTLKWSLLSNCLAFALQVGGRPRLEKTGMINHWRNTSWPRKNIL